VWLGGAGGKGTWGKLTEMYEEDGHTRDANDPNYDSIEEDVSSVARSLKQCMILRHIHPCLWMHGLLLQEEYVVSPSSPHMTLEDFEKSAVEMFMEYFEHGDTQEVAESLEEINIRNFKPEVHAR
jgi:programmed cell death protein 4